MDLLHRPTLSADYRIAYGTDPSQFGDLWLPALPGTPPAPLLVFFHGGWWKSEYDLDYAGYFCRALRGAGIAIWSLEYRRRGTTGGGWPTTFQDAAKGFDFVTTLARRFPVDLSRVVVAGHSAGRISRFGSPGDSTWTLKARSICRDLSLVCAVRLPWPAQSTCVSPLI